MSELGFPCKRRVDVQWGDVDRMQHVNNVVFFRWMETARTYSARHERVHRRPGARSALMPVTSNVSLPSSRKVCALVPSLN